MSLVELVVRNVQEDALGNKKYFLSRLKIKKPHALDLKKSKSDTPCKSIVKEYNLFKTRQL